MRQSGFPAARRGPPRPPTRFVVPPLLRAWLALLFVAAAGARAEILVYRGELRLEWGTVEWVADGTPRTEAGWFTRALPDFAAGNALPASLAAHLRDAFAVAAATHANAPVWRIHAGLAEDLHRRAVEAGAVTSGLFTLSPVPDEPAPDAGRTMVWPFRLRCEPAAAPVDAVPPRVELALLVDEVPAGEAWRIAVPAALALPRVRTLAVLTAEEERRISAAGAWLDVFFVAEASLRPEGVPVVRDAPSAEPFAVPLAFAVRAILAIDQALGPDRAFTTEHDGRLAAALAPGGPAAFPGSHRWFPEPDPSQNELGLTAVETGRSAAALVRIGRPVGGAFAVERVLPLARAWAIRVGPFRRLAPPEAAITKMIGREGPVEIVQLASLLADHPDELARRRAEIRVLEDKLRTAARAKAAAMPDYFWLPDVARAHAHALRSIERLRFVTAPTATFLHDRIEYAATYSPAPITAKIGASYEPEHRLGANAAVTWNGLFAAGDAFSLSGTYANHQADGSLTYTRPLLRSLDGRTRQRLELSGSAGQDERFRLGGLGASPFTHRLETAALAHVLTHDGAGWTVEIRHTVVAESHRLTPVTGSPRRERGLLVRHEQHWRRPPGRPNGAAWDHAARIVLEYGPAGGWNHAFGRGEIGGASTLHFGGDDARSFYVRGIVNAGASTGTLPAALSYRAGEADRFYGLEPGEFSGRASAHARGEFAYALEPLLGRLFRDAGGSPAVPDAVAGLHLVAVAEAGRITDAPAPWRGTGRSLTSYGALVEKDAGERGGLRVGYAWSPDSRRTRGRVFTSLHFAF